MRKLILIFLLLICNNAFAQNTPLATMPVASALSGTEAIWCQQSSTDKQCNPSIIATYFLSQIYAGAFTNGVPITTTTSTLGGDANSRRSFEIRSTLDISNLNPAFANITAGTVFVNPLSGDNAYGGQTSAKTTFIPYSFFTKYQAAGQRFGLTYNTICLGMGDCFGEGKTITFATADNVGGDEGVGFTAQSQLTQPTSLVRVTITGIPTQATINSTTTQAIVGSQFAQCVTVASTTGAAQDQFIVIGQEPQVSTTDIEAVKVISIGSGCINAVYRNSHLSGITVTPAKVLTIDTTDQIGQQRVMVNLSGSNYATGTISSIVGGGFVGTGTAWTNSIVGGTASNIGAIALTPDDLTASPFSVGNPQKSWYQITSVTNNTHLGIFSYSTAGDAAYHGNGPGAGGYIIRPSARVLMIVNNVTIVMETSAHTWIIGDTLECIVAPYPDVSGLTLRTAVYTAGGVRRPMFDANNTGARKIEGAFRGRASGGLIGGGGGADDVPYENVFIADFGAGNGGATLTGKNYAITMPPGTWGSGSCATDACGKIDWSSTFYIQPNSTNIGLDLNMTGTGTAGLLSGIATATVGSGNTPVLKWTGAIQTTATVFANLPTCASGLEGTQRAITDSSVNTWGSTITGSGSNHVGAYCNGTNWTVYAK